MAYYLNYIQNVLIKYLPEPQEIKTKDAKNIPEKSYQGKNRK